MQAGLKYAVIMEDSVVTVLKSGYFVPFQCNWFLFYFRVIVDASHNNLFYLGSTSPNCLQIY